MSTKIFILDNHEDINNFFTYSKKHVSEYAVLDVETDSLNEKIANIYGLGVCLDDKEAFYIPIRNKYGIELLTDNNLLQLKEYISWLKGNKKLIGHNIIYDTLVIKNYLGVDITSGIYADTILMKHCIDEEPPFGLKETGVAYLGAWADKAQKALYDNIQANGGKTTKNCMEMYKADTEVLGEYCAFDVIITYKLFAKFLPMLKEQGLEKLFFEEEIMPLYKECVIPMKDKGFPVDVEYFNNLKEEINKDIIKLEEEVQELISDYVEDYETNVLDEEFPIKLGGSFAKELAVSLDMPHTKAELKKFEPGTDDQHWFKCWVIDGGPIPYCLEKYTRNVHAVLWQRRFPDQKYIFNLSSSQQLAWLFFEKLGMTSTAKTEKGAPKLDANTLDALSGEHPFCDQILEYKKLQKLASTYIDGILDRQFEGIIYGSFLMFGTTSGRFSSRDPNLQNLPRVKDDDSKLSPLVLKYTNAIKKGFVSPSNYKICNADYSQLEPRAFAEASGDKLLQQAFIDKEDLYGAIAKNIWKLDCTANEVKKKYSELRQKAKVVALAVVYGAGAGKIAGVLKCSKEEAQKIIDDYLDAYPGLRGYMENCDEQVIKNGYVKNKFGRIRHLPRAKIIADANGPKILDYMWAKKNKKDELRWEFKNYLNNSKNFPIQSTAAHVVNRAMIATSRAFKKHDIDGYIAAQVHDEVTCIVREDQAVFAASLLKDAMENTTKLEVPLVAEPVIGTNWAEAK